MYIKVKNKKLKLVELTTFKERFKSLKFNFKILDYAIKFPKKRVLNTVFFVQQIDIAITDKGPVVIEVNDFWDRTGQYFIRRGWRNEIRDCYLAWKATGKQYATGEWRLPLRNKKLIKKFN